jgi:sigma-B regulation protein RsbU (phosphoserine phosphatase)
MTNARDIQMAMVPNQFPPFPERSDIDIFGRMEPAKSVGGDLYDFLIRDEQLFFCIGDVSGKGVPAALLMAVTRSLFHSIASSEQQPKRIMMRLNRAICDHNDANMFVTMFIGILDLRTGHLDYCNAGHEFPLVSGRPLAVIRNLPIGILIDWDYEWQETTLKSGDTLFLFTDGLNDAENAAGDRYGRQRVPELVDGHTDFTSQQLAELVKSEIGRYVGDTDQSDDLTMLIIKWQQPTLHTPLTAHLSMRADMDDIEQIDPFIAEASRQAGLTLKEAMHMRLALEEAVANVINHSQATFIDLDTLIDDNQLKVTIIDDGIPFDATAESPTDFSLPPDQRPPGGLGMMLLHQMTDQLDYQRTDERNVLTLKIKHYI